MKSCFAILVLFALLVNAFPQEPKPSASPTPASPPEAAPQNPPAQTSTTVAAPQKPSPDDDDVVRITTNLVQVDATVSDKAGKQVTNLTAEDFEITENGRPQKITNFAYISATSAQPTATPVASAKDAKSKGNQPFVPPTLPLRPNQVHRAVALVVDDLRMSMESMNATRESLRKYITQQMQPGDLVAIIRTSTGIGSLQQFTNDRQQLFTAIDRLKTIARADGRAGAFTSINMLDRLETQVAESLPSDNEASADRRKREASTAGALGDTLRASEADRSEGINEFRDKLLTVGTLGALNFVVRGLRDLPGRKAVVLFSDGISIFASDAGDRNARVLTALRQLIDKANRSSVVFYTIDTRGLQPTGFQAADWTGGGVAAPNGSGPNGSITGVGSITPELVGAKVLGARSAELFEGQNGLHYLADETGGVALINNNDLNRGIRRALEDIAGYYVIGYRPEESTFDPAGRRQFNKLDIKLKNHPDYKVRSRSGFVGISDEARLTSRTASEQLVAALLSPFSASDLDLQLTSFFINDESGGSAVRSILRFDANKLTFTQQPDGQYEAVVNILGVTLGESGQILDQVSRLEKIRVSEATLNRFRAEGMVGGLNVPIAKPGAYLLRVAVRDERSGKIGSAGQYIEVPNLNGKDNLVLSSLVISGNNTEGSIRRQSLADLVKSLAGNSAAAHPPTAATPPNQIFVAGGEGMVGTEDPKAGPASRRFRNKMFLNFACLVYTGKRDGRKLQLLSQVRLFHDGQEVFTGQPTPLDMTQQTDFKRLVIARRLFLGTVLEPGDYILHVTISDNSSGKVRAATRWLDFRIDP